jgi:hypothetical protein
MAVATTAVAPSLYRPSKKENEQQLHKESHHRHHPVKRVMQIGGKPVQLARMAFILRLTTKRRSLLV